MFSLVSRLANVWTAENRISSDSQVRQAELPNLEREDMKGLYGRLVEVDGPLSDGMEACGVFQPGRNVTTNCFDKGQLYFGLNSVQEYLTALGINIPGIMTSGSSQTGTAKAFPVRAHANAVSDLNAWYNPQTKDLTFGTYGDMRTGKDMWHLASDGDVATHELGHLLLDQINPALGRSWRGDGRAIHEGFADSLAALYADDPEMSEDFAVAMGRAPSKKDGLRSVDNDLTMNDVSDEEHDKGRVYGGFFWSVKKALSDPNGPFRLDSRQAADLTLRILFNHAALYSTATPSSLDFVNAVIRAIDSMSVSSIPMFVKSDDLKAFVMAEADRRKMLTPKKKTGESAGLEPDERSAAKKAGPGARFVTAKSSPYQGGTYEILQQQYMTSRGVYIDVVGGAIHIQKGADGRPVMISSRDVRPIRPGEINEQINISPSRALGMVVNDAYQRVKASQSWMLNIWNARPGNFADAFASLQMDFRIAEATLNRLTDRNALPPKIDLVVAPDSNDLHYEILAGMGTYYVNARTGEIKFRREVFVN